MVHIILRSAKVVLELKMVYLMKMAVQQLLQVALLVNLLKSMEHKSIMLMAVEKAEGGVVLVQVLKLTAVQQPLRKM